MHGGRRGGKQAAMNDYPSTPPIPQDVRDLQADANRLAAQIEAHRQQFAGPVPAPVRQRWWRFLLFPLTMRKFERVFFCQGESFLPRWVQAFRCAKITVRT